MPTSKIIYSPEVDRLIEGYPEQAKIALEGLRKLVHEVALDTEEISGITETLKWGEPSFVTKHGSTMRMDWKPKQPNQYALYFQCTSQLVPTFKAVYGDLFNYEGNRAVVFKIEDEELPTDEIKNCMKAALTYHQVKNLPYLGMA